MATLASRKDLTPEEAAAQTEMDFLVPFSDRRPLLTVQEVAKILDRSQDFVIAMVEEGKLEALAPTDREKRRLRITRRSTLLLLATMFMGDPRTFLDRLLRTVDALDARQCEAVIKRATARRARL
jgi:excisionase family DNA binding protein